MTNNVIRNVESGHLENLINLISAGFPRQRIYRCQICARPFKFSGDLKRHILRHTGEKPHKCPSCDYHCARQDNLKKHMRTCRGRVDANKLNVAVFPPLPFKLPDNTPEGASGFGNQNQGL